MVANFYGRICAVFGGSRGIGRAICEALADRGGSVAVISRDKERATKCVEGLPRTTDGRHMSVACDIACHHSVKNCVNHIQGRLGQIDILVNVAGINHDNLLLRTKPDEIENIIRTNLIGSVHTSQAVLKSMLRRKCGVIINIGSIVGMKGNVGQCIYASSKFGLVGFTKSLAKEVASRNIRVNIVAPGFIETDMTSDKRNKDPWFESIVPLGRYGKPQEVAEAVLFLAEMPYITGQALVVDGGLALSI